MTLERARLGRGSRPAAGIRRVRAFAVAALVAATLITSAAAGPTLPLHGSISVSKTGTGSGLVVSSPPGINCGSICSGSFVSTDDPPNYQPVTLTATPATGSVFDGWSGVCSGDGSCTIDPVERGVSYSATAKFTLIRPSEFPLTVSVTGSGRVKSSPAGIDCGQACSASFATDSTLTLTQTPTPGWSFAGWGGACTGTGACTVTMSDPRSVTATFAPPETAYALVVSAEGGIVTSDIEGISCGSSCAASYGSGVTVTLNAQGGAVAWGGACSGGSPTCQVTMNGPAAVTAAFDGRSLTRAPLALAVVGKGSVSSSPAGIACGTVCGALFSVGATVSLAVAPAEGWIFAGWSGACSGVATQCRVVMNGPRTTRALFVEAGTRFPLAVTTAGKGMVRSRPGGISCGKTCSALLLAGSTVTLEAVAAEGWKFVRWSGACTRSKPSCVLGMDGPKSVSATFGRLADQTAPKVTALPSVGEPGSAARLRYRLTEKSGRSREWATVVRGHKRLATVRGPFHDVEAGVLYYFLPWRVPASLAAGTLRFCVWAVDATGNRSKPSCARLRIG